MTEPLYEILYSNFLITWIPSNSKLEPKLISPKFALYNEYNVTLGNSNLPLKVISFPLTEAICFINNFTQGW